MKVNERRKFSFSKEEKEILRWLSFKALVPLVVAVIISSAILYFGLFFLMNKVGFDNYGVSPAHVSRNVSQFIVTYLLITITNILVMLALSTTVIYLVLHNIVMPVLRVTREIRYRMETPGSEYITVRKTDKLFAPLVELINKLLTN